MNPVLLSHIEVLDAIDKIARFPDDATVTAEFAALYLGISPKSLSRYRQNGSGPAYIQYPAKGTTARNQLVNYKMKALREWQNQNTVASTMDAAVRRGMSFLRVNDLLTPQPFWVSSDQTLYHALDSDINTFVRRLESQGNHIVWLNWTKVFDSTWIIPAELETCKNAYVSLLNQLLLKAVN